MTYDFMTLSPDDFETLVADLLSRHWGVPLESFKPGKDRGIDLRNSRVVDGKPAAIVQCKRYAPHKFAELQRIVENERAKLDTIRPAQYVLATSVALSPSNKEALLRVLDPWCKSTGDIYGQSELNGILRNHGDIETAHFIENCINNAMISAKKGEALIAGCNRGVSRETCGFSRWTG